MTTATVIQTKTPETFRVGEKVTLLEGEYRGSVIVFAVDGDMVIAGTHREIAKIYVPRADGKHVKLGTSQFAIMPDMIFHPAPRTAPAHRKVTRWDRIAKFFA